MTIRNRDISSLSAPTGVARNCPFPREISAESDPPLR